MDPVYGALYVSPLDIQKVGEDGGAQFDVIETVGVTVGVWVLVRVGVGLWGVGVVVGVVLNDKLGVDVDVGDGLAEIPIELVTVGV